jgi:hypothetical protein
LGADKRAEISLVAGFIHALMYFSFDYADVFAKIMNSSGHNIDSAFEAVFNAVPEVVAKKAARSAAADD